MMNTGRRKFVAGAGALAGSAMLPASAHAQNASARTRGIKGEIAPELEIDYWIDANGEPSTFSVKENAGKWVLLKCFQNWCPGCHSTGFPTLKAFADEFHDNPKVAIAGVQTVFEGYDSNTVEDVRKLQLRYELPIVMGHDPGNAGDPADAGTRQLPKTMTSYRTGGTPWLILIDPQQEVVFDGFHIDKKSLIRYVNDRLV